jgi:leucine-rich repeat protein SHOC2
MVKRKSTLFFVLLLVVYTATAQPRMRTGGGRQVMRFKSKEDSVRLLTVQQKIDEIISKKKFSQKALDSLMELQKKLYDGTYFVTIYEPRRDFILADSLEKLANLDEVYHVSVYRKSEIPNLVFKCKNLIDLEIIHSALDELPRQFNDLPNLTTLYLFNNTSKSRLKLPRNNTVKTLEIRTPDPGKLPKSFKNFKALEKLDLSENKLSRFPNGARKNKKLIELNLQRNEITLETKIKKHRSLERLALHGNQISYVPASIKNLPNLKKLNFNINQIDRVHRNIGKLQMIEQLSFYNNKLTEIPAGVYQLKSLLEIDLFHNSIETIAPEFAHWKNLTTLYLSHNKLTALPENIDTLKALTGIYVWENRIGKLPERVGKMPQLKFLRINHNYLKEIPSSFYELANIEEIDFSHNYITEITASIFNYPKLKIIAMFNNPWTKPTWEMIRRKTEELRKREDVYVHISEEESN